MQRETNIDLLPCHGCDGTGTCRMCTGRGCDLCQTTGVCPNCEGGGINDWPRVSEILATALIAAREGAATETDLASIAAAEKQLAHWRDAWINTEILDAGGELW
jgi:hypothetical protein